MQPTSPARDGWLDDHCWALLAGTGVLCTCMYMCSGGVSALQYHTAQWSSDGVLLRGQPHHVTSACVVD